MHTAQGMTTDVVHGIVTGTEDRRLLYTMLTRGRVENHAHIVLAGRRHARAAQPDRRPCDDRNRGARRDPRPRRCRRLRHLDARRATSPAAQLHDAVTRYADAVTLASSKLRADPEDAGPGPIPWLPGIPEVLADHPSWGPYLSARSRRVSALAGEVARRGGCHVGPCGYDDVLTADLRRELAVWRAATGVPADGRSLVGPPPNDDSEAAYHRNLTNRINAHYSEAL